MDAFSETMLGYYISDSENYEAQYNSFRMAIQTARFRPYEIVTDNRADTRNWKLHNSLKEYAMYSGSRLPIQDKVKP